MNTHPTESLDEALGAPDTVEAAFRIAAILARRALSDEEQNTLAAWLHDAHAADTLATAMNCDFQLRHAPATVQHSVTQASRHRDGTHFTRGLLALAASLLLVGMYLLLRTDLLSPGTIYQTAIGGRLTAVLDDGTAVTLNTASAIRWLGKGCDRRVALLRGEVLFDVRTDPHCPFTVLLETGVSISVLGTLFDTYRNDNGQIEVTVLEGRVELRGTHWTQVLKPAQSARLRDHNLTLTEHANTEQHIGWLKDQVTFDNLPLSDAIQELQRYTKLPIKIADSKLAALRITGVFSTQNIRATLTRLESLPAVDEQHPGIRLEQLSNGTLLLHAVHDSGSGNRSHP